MQGRLPNHSGDTLPHCTFTKLAFFSISESLQQCLPPLRSIKHSYYNSHSIVSQTHRSYWAAKACGEKIRGKLHCQWPFSALRLTSPHSSILHFSLTALSHSVLRSHFTPASPGHCSVATTKWHNTRPSPRHAGHPPLRDDNTTIRCPSPAPANCPDNSERLSLKIW
ncbi:hypothetical protein K461DRAFT_170277 [Myriangium duriaei CBS 260.36]|uniref:Uncharacterized protein n=1 Tax=Myriangium duriaei CBS 260.36 TaxID=1168546 RepID=A0A9P4MFL1_9PEZI|nr:hypothetical protein K461DRAFT_170277 [Myriangium duriaei CBS 260.36]